MSLPGTTGKDKMPWTRGLKGDGALVEGCSGVNIDPRPLALRHLALVHMRR
jgi:hypothetical protein